MPLIVLEESNLSSTGQSYRGLTWRGEREAPGRIEARVEKKEIPASTQWSSTEEHIASLVKDVGFDHPPAVAVVIHRERSQADVYVHSAGSNTWQLPSQEVVSTEQLQTPSLLESKV